MINFIDSNEISHFFRKSLFGNVNPPDKLHLNRTCRNDNHVFSIILHWIAISAHKFVIFTGKVTLLLHIH